jgi:hypothetical protein
MNLTGGTLTTTLFTGSGAGSILHNGNITPGSINGTGGCVVTPVSGGADNTTGPVLVHIGNTGSVITPIPLPPANLTGLTVTSPGIGYTAVPTITLIGQVTQPTP